MRVREIDTIEKWLIFERALNEKGWRLSSFQYAYYEKEGFHAWFIKLGNGEEVEVVTRNKEVQEAIVGFNSRK